MLVYHFHGTFLQFNRHSALRTERIEDRHLDMMPRWCTFRSFRALSTEIRTNTHTYPYLIQKWPQHPPILPQLLRLKPSDTRSQHRFSVDWRMHSRRNMGPSNRHH